MRSPRGRSPGWRGRVIPTTSPEGYHAHNPGGGAWQLWPPVRVEGRPRNDAHGRAAPGRRDGTHEPDAALPPLDAICQVALGLAPRSAAFHAQPPRPGRSRPLFDIAG